MLGFLISSRIFQQNPELTEGELSRMKAYLEAHANLCGWQRAFIWEILSGLAEGEEKTGGRTKRAIIVDAFEAIIGALYLDGGVAAASDFVGRQIGQDSSKSLILSN